MSLHWLGGKLRNEQSISSWLSSLSVRVVPKSPRHIPSGWLDRLTLSARPAHWSNWTPASPSLQLLLGRKREQDQQPHLTNTTYVVRELTLQPYQFLGQFFSNLPRSIHSWRSAPGSSAASGAAIHNLVYRLQKCTEEHKSL